MKKLNLHDVYAFGKRLQPLAGLAADTKIQDAMFNLWFAREALDDMLHEESPLLKTARRAVGKLIGAISEVIPKDISQCMEIDRERAIGWQVSGIKTGLQELESVLGNDMPDIAAYVVSQKGIYRTDDLIAHAEHQLSADVRKAISELACFDLRQAGKCLAYELSTACAFHLWRAVETVMGDYFKELSGGASFDAAKVTRNWGAYITALKAKSAEPRITVFLDHIRQEYRNPQTHPDEIIDVDEAARLFPVAISSIDQMMRAIASLRAPATPTMPAIGRGLAAMAAVNGL